MTAKKASGAFVTAKGPVWVDLAPGSGGAFTCTVPTGVAGQSYVLLNDGKKTINADTILAGPTFIEVSS